MSVTFAPEMPNSYWTSVPEVLSCIDTEIPFATMLPGWRETFVELGYSYNELALMSGSHCTECMFYAPMPQRLKPEGWAELNVTNTNAARILSALGLIHYYTDDSDGRSYPELSGTIALEDFEQSLVIAAWTGSDDIVHRYSELRDLVAACRKIGATKISYA